jgi:hypothetical protein
MNIIKGARGIYACFLKLKKIKVKSLKSMSAWWNLVSREVDEDLLGGSAYTGTFKF